MDYSRTIRQLHEVEQRHRANAARSAEHLAECQARLDEAVEVHERNVRAADEAASAAAQLEALSDGVATVRA